MTTVLSLANFLSVAAFLSLGIWLVVCGFEGLTGSQLEVDHMSLKSCPPSWTSVQCTRASLSFLSPPTAFDRTLSSSQVVHEAVCGSHCPSDDAVRLSYGGALSTGYSDIFKAV